MSDLDKIRQAFPDLQDASDSDVLGEVSRLTGVRFEDVADVFGVAPRGTIGESVRQLGGGLAVDLPRMTGQALKYTGLAPELGERLVEGAERRAPGFTPDMRGRGLLGQALTSGARGLGPVAAAVPAFFLPGGQVVAPLALGGLFGTSSAQDTYEKLTEQGVDPEAAAVAARKVGLLQGAGETAATFVGARTIVPLARGLRGARTTGEVAERLTDTRVLAPFARRLGTNVVVQAGTEAGQDVGTELIERSYGARPEDIGDIAQQSALAGGGMALWLGPLSFGGSVSRARRSEELKRALYDENVDPQVRAQAMDFVMSEAQRQNIAPENVDAWFENLLQVEDARTAALAAAEERASAEALANRNRSLDEMVKQQGLTRGLTDQDLLTPGVTSAQIDRELGIDRRQQDPKKYIKNFTKAFDEPSGQFVSDPETGVERELTVGEYYQRQSGPLDLTQEEPTKTAVATEAATQSLRDPRSLFLRDTLGVVPTASALRLMDAIEQDGIPMDSSILAPVLEYARKRPMNEDRLKAAIELLDAAVIKSRRDAAVDQQEVVPVVSTPGVVSESAGVSPAAAPAVAGLSQEAQVETQPTEVPAAPVIETAPAAEAQQQTAAPTPQVVETAPEVDPRIAALATIFGDRNANIMFDVMGMGMPLEQAAQKYNMSTSNVGKIAGMERDAVERRRKQMDRASARGVDVGAVERAFTSMIRESAEQRAQDIEAGGMQNMFDIAAATEQEAEAAGLEGRIETAGGSEANTAAKVTQSEQRMFEVLEALATETDPQVVAELQAELETYVQRARTDSRRNQQEVRRTAGRQTEVDTEGETDAVQEQTAAEVPVQPEARGRQEVERVPYPPAPQPGAPAYLAASQRAVVDFMNGELTRVELQQKFADLGMTEAQQRSVTNRIEWFPSDFEAVASLISQQEGQAQTTQEKYAQVVSAVPGAPAFADLTRAQQDQITDLANRDQLNLAAVNRIFEGDTRAMTRGEPAAGIEGRELKETMDSLARGMTRVGGVTDFDGNSVDLTPTTPEALRKVTALAEVFDSYSQLGLANSLNAVKNWYVTSTPVTWDGVFTTVDGKPSVVLNARVLMTLPEESAWTLRHEIGHAIDEVQHGGNYSANSLFNVSVTADRIIPRGQLMQDVVNFRTNNPDSELAQHLKYPLDMEHTGRLSVDELRQEVFGQLWAFYSGSQANRDFMEDNLPFVFDYFDQGVSNEVKSADYESDAGSPSQAASQQEQAATQAEGVQSGRVRSSQQVQGVVRAHVRSPRVRLENLNRIPEPARGPARALTTMLGDVGGRFLDRAMFTSDLTNRAVALGMQSAGKLQRDLAARDFMAREEERAVESILDGYAELPDNERGTGEGSVNRFLFDSTRSGKWGYGDRADPEMAKRFEALSAPAKKFVQDIFAHGDRMLQRKKDLVMDATRSEYDAQIENAKTAKEKAELRKDKQAALKRYDSLFKIREGKPYAPIKRTGNYVVIAMSKEYMQAKAEKNEKRLAELESDGNHYHVTFTSGKLAGQDLRRQLEEQGSFAEVQLAERDQVTDELFSNESAMQQLSKLRANVDARVKAGDSSARKMLDIINQMYLDALSEGSARKSEMKRRAVDGEVDMIASFGQQGRADATFLASLQYSDAVNDSLNAMREESRTGDRTRKSEVLNELVRRYSESLDVPDSPFINKLTRLSSVYFLATSPAYYLQNLTQPFMMSVPAMAGRHNYLKVNAELGKAYTELGPVMRSAKLFSQQLKYDQVPQDVKGAIDELVNRGRIDLGLDAEMGEFKVDGDGRIADSWNRVDKGLRMAVQKGEAVNRLSTAIAAYRLEFEKTKDAKKAIDYADRILMETHGDYSRYNAPRIFNTSYGRIALQFRKFQLIQLSWYSKLFKEAFTNPEERAAAIKTLAFGLAHTGVLAGAMGIPGYAAIAWALSTVFGDEDEPFDLTDSIRKMVGDPEVANVILRGAPVLGGSDWSGKIGAGNMLSIMPFSNADLTTRSGFYEAMGTIFGGASAGMVVRGIDGIGLAANGDYMKGFELMLPKGLGDVIKAYRLSEDGATRRNNDVILPESELNALEIAWQAIGIPPAQITTMYEKQERVRNVEQRFRNRTTSIKNSYTKAIRQGNSADAAKAREDWKNLQDARVRAGLKRQPFSELVRAPREQARRERDTAGGVQFRRGTERMVEDIVER